MQYQLEVTFTGKSPRSGRCVVCGCTNEQACEVPCTWADDRELLCSNCLAAVCQQTVKASAALQCEPRSFRGRKEGPHKVALTVRLGRVKEA